jgi:hypothetical protein
MIEGKEPEEFCPSRRQRTSAVKFLMAQNTFQNKKEFGGEKSLAEVC